MAQKVHVETVFAEAIEIASPQERAAFLDRACQEDPGLRQEVEKLVVDHFRAGQFLEHPVAQISAPTLHQPILERPGTQIGPYKLLQVIGEGGMGTVFLAEQTEPVRRTGGAQGDQAGHGLATGHRALRCRETGPGHDGPCQYRPRSRRGHHANRVVPTS